jgi:hypothetical protein
METTMRSLVLAAAFAAATLASSGTAALADGPWCATYNNGGTNCGFYTYRQCAYTVRGIGGHCYQNPWFFGRYYR